MRLKITEAREAADRRIIMIDVCNLNRYRPLRGLCKIFLVDDPGVSLRFTSGYPPLKLFKVREAAASIKPGVERSGTPGTCG